MDSDVGYPTGYIKVEINCQVARLQISLSNLLNRQDLIYQLYGIKKDDKQLIYTLICDVPNESGKADVKISADIYSIGSNHFRLEDINIFAIITQVPNRTPSIKCPLVAYLGGEVLWKKEFEALLLNNEQLTSNNNIAKNVAMNNIKSDKVYDSTTESKSTQNSGIISTVEKVNDLEQETEAEQIPNMLSEIGLFEGLDGETNALEQIKSDETILDNIANEQNGISENMDSSEIKVIEDIENTEAAVSEDTQIDNEEILIHPNVLNKEFNILEEILLQNDTATDKKVNISDKFESAVTNIYNPNKSTLVGQEKTSEVVLADNDILNSVHKNFTDISLIDIGTDEIKNEFNLPSLKEELNKSFESYNPFNMKSKNFRWWKINSPGYLNNILFRNSVKSYLLFNPKVMLAHYKYRYIIFGIRNDKHSSKEFLICGVPGVYSIDENPFGNMGSWAQIEGYKPKYGAFGYWIILIDPRTGKLMKVK